MSDHNAPRVPPVAVVVACTVLALAALTVYVVLTLSGSVDAQANTLVLLVLAAVLPQLGGQVWTNSKLRTVERQTNGNVSRLLEIIERQGDVIAAAEPVNLPRTAPPATPEELPPLAGSPRW